MVGMHCQTPLYCLSERSEESLRFEIQLCKDPSLRSGGQNSVF